jgi:hypothetical protein
LSSSLILVHQQKSVPGHSLIRSNIKYRVEYDSI